MIYEIVGQHWLKPTINAYDDDHDVLYYIECAGSSSLAQAGATGSTGRAQPEAPPAATHEDCLGRCDPLSAARTGSRAAAAALSPSPESRTTS